MQPILQTIKAFIFAHKKLSLAALAILIVLFVGWRLLAPRQSAPQYQTATVTRGTLITSVSASGSVSIANKTSVTTQASGMVNTVYVKDGDTVSAGQVIATVTLDQSGQQKQATAWASYLSAQNTLNAAKATQYTLQNSEFVANQKFMNDAVANGKPTDDPLYVEEQASWLAAEAAYKNQAGVISADESSLTSSWLSYQAVSATITAPTAGKLTDLTLTPGMQLSGGSSSSSNVVTPQSVASIETSGTPVVTVDIAEVDIPHVVVGQKATLTFDALPNETFTGKITGIDTTGVVSSGVTTYPATIVLDTPSDKIFPNMSVTANIITSVKDNVLLVPSSAVQTIGSSPSVRILRNGQLTSIPVTVGSSSDSQTEITSGLSEGQTIVTNVLTSSTIGTGVTSSPFSAVGGRGFGGGGVIFRGSAAGGR